MFVLIWRLCFRKTIRVEKTGTHIRICLLKMHYLIQNFDSSQSIIHSFQQRFSKHYGKEERFNSLIGHQVIIKGSWKIYKIACRMTSTLKKNCKVRYCDAFPQNMWNHTFNAKWRHKKSLGNSLSQIEN